jgi:TonB family protein
MRLLLFFAAVLSFSFSLQAQSTSEGDSILVPDTTIYTIVEKSPEFPGGNEKMFEFLGSEIQYPKKALRKKKEGRVYVGFVVERNGELSKIKVIRDLVGYGCGEEAIRVIKLMPKWIPGYHRNEAKRVQVNIPIIFKL